MVVLANVVVVVVGEGEVVGVVFMVVVFMVGIVGVVGVSWWCLRM